MRISPNFVLRIAPAFDNDVDTAIENFRGACAGGFFLRSDAAFKGFGSVFYH